MWINRDISGKIKENTDLIQILRGPRQCGKSSLILHLDPSFKELSLDDFRLRELAQTDPELFLNQFGNDVPLFIDEAQYAPALFPALKRRADLAKRGTSSPRTPLFRITGSNQILMDRNVKESLAGRASYFDMNTLSVSEILNFAPRTSVQEILFKGGWPELYADPNKDTKKYLNDYISSYVEKDIILSAGIQKHFEFNKFIKLIAGRVGQLVDFSDISSSVQVDSKTIKEWISILEKMNLVSLVQPYFSNASSRLTKSPKLYFIDTGLACRLQGWTSFEPIITSPQQGSLFENLVYSEIYKTIINYQLDWRVYHWRSRDGEEIDFLLQFDPENFLFIESKVSFQKPKNPQSYKEVKKVFKNQPPPLIHCHQEGEQVINQNVPIRLLKNYLLDLRGLNGRFPT